MTDELRIEVPAETKRAIERVAAARGMSVAEFVQNAMRKSLIEAGFIDDEGQV